MSKSKSIDVHSLPLHPIDESPEKFNKILSKKEERELQKMFDESQMESYFMKAQGKTPFETIELAGFMYSDEGIRKISTDIRKGEVKVPPEIHSVDSYLIKEKISEEEKRVMDLRIKRQQIQRQLEYLDQQTSLHSKSATKADQNEDQSILYKPSNVLSKEEHENFVNKIIKQRDIMDKRHNVNVKKIEKSRQEEKQRLEKKSEEKIQKAKEKRRKQIHTKLQKKKEDHDKVIAFELETRKAYNQVKKKQFLHEKIEAKYQSQVLVPALEEKKKRLKEIREISKAFNVQELKNHEKEYLEKRNHSFSVHKSRANEDWHYKAPEKTERLSRFLEEQKIEQRKNLEAKKRAIDEKISRQEQFIQYLKDKFPPKVDEKKQKELQERIQRTTSKRKQSQTDSKILGISYLEQAKRMKKKTIDRPETEKYSQKSQNQTNHHLTKRGATDYLMLNRKEKEFYENRRRKRIDNLMHSEASELDKIKKLKREEEKISQEFRRKEELMKFHGSDKKSEEDALELLLSGIKAKMGIIEVFKHGHESI